MSRCSGLYFLNNEFVHKQAAALAERAKTAGNEDAQVRKVFEIVYQRDPSADELAAALNLLHDATVPPAAPAMRAGVSMQSVAFAAKPDSEMKTDSPAAAQPSPAPKQPESPLEALCWALLSSNEFLFLN